MDIQEQLEFHIRKIALMEPHEVFHNGLNLEFDLGLDSLDTIELTMEIEKDFDITIDDSYCSDYENIKTVGDCFAYLEKHFDIKTSK